MDVGAAEAGIEVDPIVEVLLHVIAEVKVDTMNDHIVTGEVGVTVVVEVDLVAIAVDVTEETGTEEIETAIGTVRAEGVEAEGPGGHPVTVEAEV